MPPPAAGTAVSGLDAMGDAAALATAAVLPNPAAGLGVNMTPRRGKNSMPMGSGVDWLPAAEAAERTAETWGEKRSAAAGRMGVTAPMEW